MNLHSKTGSDIADMISEPGRKPNAEDFALFEDEVRASFLAAERLGMDTANTFRNTAADRVTKGRFREGVTITGNVAEGKSRGFMKNCRSSGLGGR